MSLIGNIKDLVSGKRLTEPVLLKPVDNENNQLTELRALLDEVSDDQKSKVEEQISLINRGLKGEENIEYELKNMAIPLISLHDINVEKGDRSSQIDFIVITKKCMIVIESKNLYGQIKINGDSFIREFRSKDNNVYKQQRIYSPVSQNEKHVSLLKQILEEKKFIDYPIHSLVVISDANTIVDNKNANKEVKDIVVNYDVIKKKIIGFMNASEYELSATGCYELAEILLKEDKGYKSYYVNQLKLKFGANNKVEEKQTEDNIEDLKEEKPIDSINIEEQEVKKEPIKAPEKANDELYEKIKQWRYKKSQELNQKPYFIFNNDVLSELIIQLPKTKEDLLKISGFGETKVNNFGDELLTLINGKKEVQQESKQNKDEELYEELKTYRKNKAEKYNIPAYAIFKNDMLDEIVKAKPLTKEEYLKIKGLDEKSYQYNGKEIIEIISKYKN